MQYREFGKTKEQVSVLGFGCMRFQTDHKKDNQILEELAIKQLRSAIDMGVNYVDTAYPYHGGESEPLVGKALQDGYREKVKLATKLPCWLINSREDMDKYLNEQLEKLQTDYVDFYLLHSMNKGFWKRLKEHDVFDFIKKALEDGRIKHIGFSFHDDLPLFKEIVDAYDWDFCQIQYNYLDEAYQAGLEGMLYARERGLGIVVMEPLRGGSLTKEVPADVQAIWDKADTKRSPAEWALKFIWDRPEVDVILSGMNDMAHIEENIKVAKETLPNSLSDAEKALIDEVKAIYQSKIKVNCTSCEYCLPCPVGIHIPGNFGRYNYASMFSYEEGKKRYEHLDAKARADQCVSCGECESKCPQHIPIRERLKEMAEYFAV
ncbi:aldo/keto reductase [Vallitalea pronyensis]|uniref:Aldo/keto reductase n=1 Tax=Vallitalea pronyensis TaxID=1348613 RepID=A0A8J8MJW5_9FIRM|nr:aldo/keto reductase [Vallitalea pronyensis]QUI23000.1 aldo/keto reductase [Vallitalea pronyensis]